MKKLILLSLTIFCYLAPIAAMDTSEEPLATLQEQLKQLQNQQNELALVLNEPLVTTLGIEHLLSQSARLINCTKQLRELLNKQEQVKDKIQQLLDSTKVVNALT